MSAPAPMLASRPATEVVPLDADLRRLHLTVSKRLLAKLDAARAALSHSHPGASFEEILEVGLDLVIDRHARRRGLVKRSQTKPRPAKPETITARVSRAVWTRDEGRCQWPLDSGGVCGSTVRVQLHHLDPEARGGPPTEDNLVCVCARHNDLAARRDFGDRFMDRFTRRRGKGATGAPK